MLPARFRLLGMIVSSAMGQSAQDCTKRISGLHFTRIRSSIFGEISATRSRLLDALEVEVIF